MNPRWEHFSHQADIGVRGIGHSLEEAFEQAAVALCAVIAEPQNVSPQEDIHIELQAAEPEILLVDWLNRIIYEMAVRNMLFSHFDVKFAPEGLEATASGEAVDKLKHEPAVEVKGATFTELCVTQRPDGTWIAQCIVDV